MLQVFEKVLLSTCDDVNLALVHMLRLLEMLSQFGPSAHNQFNSPTPVDIEERNNQRAIFSWKILTVENTNVILT